MTQEFVTYSQALALKELGFDEPCFGLWNLNNGRYEVDIIGVCNYSKDFKYREVLAPLYQQAFRWFREKHGICSWIQRLYNEYGNPYYTIIHEYKTDLLSRNHTVVANLKEYNTYEEAEQACLNKLIEICKNK